MSKHPLVISIKPARTLEILLGKRFNMGESEVITTKNIAIIVPTEIILSAESSTISERVDVLEGRFCWFFNGLSSFTFKFLYKIPFKHRTRGGTETTHFKCVTF